MILRDLVAALRPTIMQRERRNLTDNGLDSKTNRCDALYESGWQARAQWKMLWQHPVEEFS